MEDSEGGAGVVDGMVVLQLVGKRERASGAFAADEVPKCHVMQCSNSESSCETLKTKEMARRKIIT